LVSLVWTAYVGFPSDCETVPAQRAEQLEKKRPQSDRRMVAGPLPADTQRMPRAGVGVTGMCLTGNLVLSVMLDESVLVPVMCEPAVPFMPWSKERKAALGVPARTTPAI